jgi:copper chaperone
LIGGGGIFKIPGGGIFPVEEKTMTTVTLKISGMHCGGCVVRVSNLLKRVEGVSVEDVQIGSARISASSSAALRSAEDALAKAGYTISADA